MPSISRLRVALAGVLMPVVLVACAGAASGTVPGPTAGPVTTPTEALARVVAQEPRLAGVPAFDTGLIGQASWYTAEPGSGESFVVTVRVGWGDCESGCIDEHSWVYAVGADGTVTVASESGPAVPADAWPSPNGSGRTGLGGVALAGPVCPVERVPPDPACAPRPVVGATILIRDAGGSEIARTVTGADGSFFVELPAGEYAVEPLPAEGLLGTAPAQEVSVVDGAVVSVQLDYDTGIR